MKSAAFIKAAVLFALVGSFLSAPLLPGFDVSAQSGRQPEKKKAEKKTDVQKGQEPQEQEPPLTKDAKNQVPLKLSTQVVNVDVSVIDKKSGRLIPNLTPKNFTIYEDGIKQEATNFNSGQGPMTAVLLLENNYRNRYFINYIDPSVAQEVFQSAAIFARSFVKPQDHIALVTYSMRVKVVQDFTSDPQALYQAVVAAYRDTLNFSEANIYDALAFVLLGGKAIQLFEENKGEEQYTGLQEVAGHTSVILITLGKDTFSKLTYDKAMKIVAGAGVPIYCVHVGQLMYKKYGDRWPGELRTDFEQARNGLQTFARLSGGAYFAMTFESEIPQIMRSIEALLRNQ